MEKKIIAFCGKAGAGKSTCANFLKNYGFVNLKFADPLYDIHNYFFEKFNLPIEKNRDLLIYLGKFARTFAKNKNLNDPIIECIKSKIENGNDKIVIDDLRMIQEYKFLKENYPNCKIIKIVGRKMEIFDGADENDITETSFDKFDHDYVLNNDKDLDCTFENLIKILQVYIF